MKYVLCLALIASANSAYAVKSVQITQSSPVYGQIISSKNINDVVACGYYLTKGHAYRMWGPSITFFVKTASGAEEVLYHMHNGTRAFEPIQTLSVLTAAAYNPDEKKSTYKSVYETKEGGLFDGAIFPSATLRLTLERALKTYDRYESARELDIQKISFKKKSSSFKMDSKNNIDISCAF